MVLIIEINHLLKWNQFKHKAVNRILKIAVCNFSISITFAPMDTADKFISIVIPTEIEDFDFFSFTPPISYIALVTYLINVAINSSNCVKEMTLI